MGKRSKTRQQDGADAMDVRDDLTELGSGTTEGTVTQVLRQNLTRDQPYINIQPSVLVAVNPGKPLAIYDDAHIQSYVEQCYRIYDPQLQRPLAPHVFETAARAYLHLRRLGQDQAIVLSGMAGSGKTQSYHHIINQLCALATHSKKENKSHTQLHNALTVLEAFGNAGTLHSPDSTRFGLYQEIQFNERGRIVGAKTLAYSLDRFRVTNVPPSERNFHIFYYLLQGSSAQEKSTYQLHDASHFRYMIPMVDSTKSRFSRASYIETDQGDKSIRLEDLKAALRAVGLKSRLQTQMFQLLAGILHLGNVLFDESEDSNESATIHNPEVLATVAQFFGVTVPSLEGALTYKTKLVGTELCTVFLNQEAAEHQRDALARVLYSLLFTWIVESVNKRTCADNAANFIGLFDQYGFQVSTANRFEQLCVNFANEKLHHFVLSNIMDDQAPSNDEVVCDGIPLPQVPFQSQVATYQLFANPDGLVEVAHTLATAAAQEGHEPLNADQQLLQRFNQAGADHTAYTANVASSSRGKKATLGSFAIQHFMQPVNYSVEAFQAKNTETNVSPDFINLFRESGHNIFVNGLFNSSAIATEAHPTSETTVVAAQQTTKPTRRPTRKFTKRVPKNRVDGHVPSPDDLLKKAHEDAQANDAHPTILMELNTTLTDLFAALDETKVWHVVHVRPHPTDCSGQAAMDLEFVTRQVKALALPDIIRRRPVEFTIGFTFEEFVNRFQSLMDDGDSYQSSLQKVETLAMTRGWKANVHFAVGHSKVFFTESIWKSLEDELRAQEKGERATERASRFDQSMMGAYAADDTRSMVSGYQDPTGSDQALLHSNPDARPMSGYPGAPPQRRFMGAALAQSGYDSDANSYAASDDEFLHGSGRRGFNNQDEKSVVDSDYEPGDAFLAKEGQTAKEGNGPAAAESGEPDVEEIEVTRARRCWVHTTWALTWWIPTFLLASCGRMKRPDIQMAWREKVAICLLIVVLWAIILFYIVGLSLIMCPKQYVYTADDVAYHTGTDDMWVHVRGVVYDVSQLPNMRHGAVGGRAPATEDDILMFAGQDVNATFPVSIVAGCPQLVPASSDPTGSFFLDTDNTQNNVVFPFTHTAGRNGMSNKLRDDQFFFKYAVPGMKRMKKGDLVWKRDWIDHQREKNGFRWRVINDEVYNLDQYFLTQENHDASSATSTGFSYAFLDKRVESLFSADTTTPTDVTEFWDTKIPNSVKKANYQCLRNMFYMGKIDTREDFNCLFPYYLLLASSILLVAVIAIKFLAALQLSSKRKPQDHDKFVICQVPCYTEGEEGLRRTIDSLAGLQYDDKHKLIFLVADGNIIGSGNDRPTPRIVLDILGVDPKYDPEPLSFRSVGDGAKQHNMAKVYSGLYEFEGHVVPYIVVVKVGKPTERSRPGNRGKRDSQVVLLNFLNRVHFDTEMSPLELEVYHQMKNVIGVHPSLYEYIFMVDADTEVLPDALNRLVSCTVHDSRVVGICGETRLSNEDLSLTTMIQVYEYFISHHMAKAFESLFGSVTCLPGCFCMYRIRSTRGQPLIIHQNIIEAYSENRVDTLHKKNLLSLGEDRYLTTLIMKYFPSYKMKFTPDAISQTVAPDKWSILLSQRRRWINSTVHNLVELMFLPELCGFCCFSMRFIVFLDLFGTLAMPVTIAYLGYLLYLGISGTSDVGYVSLILIAAVYGLQALIFLIKRQWQHIGWMIIYLLATPLFSFFLPVYSFWHFDDFSWGNTRVVVGDNKKHLYITDEGKFDPKVIPLKKWAQHEQEMWEMQSNGSMDSRESPRPGSRAYSRQSHRPMTAMSQTMNAPMASRPTSRLDVVSQYGGAAAPPPTLPATAIGGPIDLGHQQRPMSTMSAGYPPADPNAMAARNSHYTSMMGSPAGMPQPMSMYGGQDYRTSRALSHAGDLQAPAGTDYFGNRPGSTASHYSAAGGMPHPQSQYMAPGFDSSLPTDDEILHEIRNILTTANLMTITKKQVRMQLNEHFHCDLLVRKDFINQSIEMILQGKR